MTTLLLVMSWLVPLLLAPLSIWRPIRWLVPLALVPAVGSLLLLPDGQMAKLDWLLLGTHLGLDHTARWFLSGSVLIWASAAIYCIKWLQSSTNAARFYLFFLLAMSGNILLILAMDMVSFYLGFALMGISAYGLIADNSSKSARKAGKIYLAWTISGEVILFCAVILLAGQANSILFAELKSTMLSETALILIVIGFGIKIALPGLHVWLPITYSALPGAAAAVFSGPMISAGLLGLIRFLANGEFVYQVSGQLLIILGFFGALYGVVLGLVQSSAKAALGYSSMSKMGLLAATMGLALIYPSYSTALIGAVTVYAVHHMLVKSALFLGIDLLQQGIAKAGIITAISILSMALAGLPLTSGSLAKAEILTALPIDTDWFYLWLSIASIASILLVARIFYLLLSSTQKAEATNVTGMVSWFGIVMVVTLFPFLFEYQSAGFSNLLPILAAIITIVLVLILKPPPIRRMVGIIPPGDILYPAKNIFNWTKHKFFHPTFLWVKSQLEALWQLLLQLWQGVLQTTIKFNWYSLSQSWAGTLWMFIAALILVFIVTGTSPKV